MSESQFMDSLLSKIIIKNWSVFCGIDDNSLSLIFLSFKTSEFLVNLIFFFKKTFEFRDFPCFQFHKFLGFHTTLTTAFHTKKMEKNNSNKRTQLIINLLDFSSLFLNFITDATLVYHNKSESADF